MALQDPKINTYKISRDWFDWCFDNPDKVKPAHTTIYFFALDQNNRFGWKEKFGLPTLHAMEGTGIKSKNTYYKAFHELVDWGFIKVVTKAKNQNAANIITIPAVSKFKSAEVQQEDSGGTALDLANIQQEDSGGNIDKQVNQQTKNKKQENEENSRAFDFLNKNYPERFETDFSMKYEKLIENKKKFVEDFNDTVELEKRTFDSALFGRLGKYARNWIENQNKYSKKPHNNEKSNYQKANRRVGRLSEEEGNKLSNPESWSVMREELF